MILKIHKVILIPDRVSKSKSGASCNGSPAARSESMACASQGRTLSSYWASDAELSRTNSTARFAEKKTKTKRENIGPIWQWNFWKRKWLRRAQIGDSWSFTVLIGGGQNCVTSEYGHRWCQFSLFALPPSRLAFVGRSPVCSSESSTKLFFYVALKQICKWNDPP